MTTCDACGRNFPVLFQWRRFKVCQWCREMAEYMDKVAAQNEYDNACENNCCTRGNS